MFREHTQPTAIAVGTFVAPAHLESLARECGLITRKNRKFSAQGLLLTLLKAISTGNASFSQMAASLGEIQTHNLSRQALHQRMNPKVIEFLQAGDLVLRDMGYFDVKGFAQIESKSAYWLSRLHGQANVFLLDGTPLEELLSTTKSNRLEVDVTLTEKNTAPASLQFAQVQKWLRVADNRGKTNEDAMAHRPGNDHCSVRTGTSL